MTRKNELPLFLSIFFLALSMVYAQSSITSYSDIRGKEITGEWKDGAVVLADGTIKNGQTKAFAYSGNSIKSFKFRQQKGSAVEVFKAGDCKMVDWDGTHILSLPKNFKKPVKGNRYYVAIYHGQNISVLFDPSANQASSGFNQGEYLKALVLKENEITEVSKLKFRKQFSKICNDSKAWKQKSGNKKWFKYSNMYDVARFYDQNSSEKMAK